MGERMRGAAAAKALIRRRAQNPVCAHCAARGVVRATHEIDHIQPLALGGDDEDDNCQGLCALCHAIKTATEGASRGGAAEHPDWLKPCTGLLTLVSGPPFAGKSEYVRKSAGENDLVISLDEIARQLRPGVNLRWDDELMNRAIRVRNGMLGSLCRLPENSRAWFVVSAPSSAELEWWQNKLRPDAVVRMVPPKAQAASVERAAKRGPVQVSAVDDWFERSRRLWRPKVSRPKRVACGDDGYPLEPLPGAACSGEKGNPEVVRAHQLLELQSRALVHPRGRELSYQCEICGSSETYFHSRGRYRKFCSIQCATVSSRKQRRSDGRMPALSVPHVKTFCCQQCGDDQTYTWTGGPDRSLCSPRCKSRAYRERCKASGRQPPSRVRPSKP